MNRTSILNRLARKINAKRYLEIGAASGSNFNDVEVEYKVGVDPNPRSRNATMGVRSDVFFANSEEQFDLIFIDGLHKRKQVYRDIMSSLLCLRGGGYVVCHDMNPTQEHFQVVPRVTTTWTGDSWKAWVQIRCQRDDLFMFVVACDYGCGVITAGEQVCLELPFWKDTTFTWDNLCENRIEWLNLLTPDEAKPFLT